jgi:hypothetical protein
MWPTENQTPEDKVPAASRSIFCEACRQQVEIADVTGYRFPEETGGKLGTVTVTHGKCGGAFNAEMPIGHEQTELLETLPKADLG